jgi:hypothetical protein
VEVYIFLPLLGIFPPHDSDLAMMPGWSLVGTVTIRPPGDSQIYTLNVTGVPPANEYTVAVRLKEGEFGPEPGKDRNVSISWVKLSTR